MVILIDAGSHDLYVCVFSLFLKETFREHVNFMPLCMVHGIHMSEATTRQVLIL